MIGLLVIGFLFRLWMANLVPQPFVYDQEEYYGYALGIINKGLHADLYRLYGYPLIIAPIIYFFGVASPLPWTLFHAVVDTATALLVFWIAKKVFRKTGPAWIAFILYLFNPFTAGYVGVLLSEIVTVFLVTLIIALLIHRKLFVSALLLGFLPQVRPAFIFLSLAVTCMIIWAKPYREKIATLIIFSIPFWYTIVGNLVYFRQFSVLGVEPTFARELYTSLFIGRGLPFTDQKWADWPVEAQRAWGEFSAPQTEEGRNAVAKKHLMLSWDIISRDPVSFLRSRIAKMGYVWEKHFVYPYVMGNPTPFVKALTYWGNLLLLCLAVVGMIHAGRVNRRAALLVLGLFLYISLASAVSTSEERFSLPAYPLVFLFAGYGVWWLLGRSKLFGSVVIDKR